MREHDHDALLNVAQFAEREFVHLTAGVDLALDGVGDVLLVDRTFELHLQPNARMREDENMRNS